MTKNTDETTVVATFSARHDAEIAKSYLADHGISSFVRADDVHVPLQLTEGVKLVVMQSQAQVARDTLTDADLIPGDMPAAAYAGDEKDAGAPADADGGWALSANRSRGVVVATAAAVLILVVLFFIPWRIEATNEIAWTPIYRPPVDYVTTFQEVDSAMVSYYETGRVAWDILFLQLTGVAAVAWVASVVEGALLRPHVAGAK